MPCDRCHDTKEIHADVGHSIQVMSCPECCPPLTSCKKNHINISGYWVACPLGVALALLPTYRVMERPNRRLKTDAVGGEQSKGTSAEKKPRTTFSLKIGCARMR